MQKLIAGNWKMNGNAALVNEMIAALKPHAQNPNYEFLICPPFTLLAAAAKLSGGAIAIGAQDCSSRISGAYTGDISADMIKEAGAGWVILGHSERRHGHGESSELIKAKAEAALAAGLKIIICVGETEAEYEAKKTLTVIEEQLARSVPGGADAENSAVAYEPVWAIGTGKVAGVSDIESVHAAIRNQLTALLPDAADKLRILYGGSVKPGNAAEIMAVPNVNGVLVGGASLVPADFLAIAQNRG